MGNDLLKKLNEIGNKLKDLEVGKVLDVSDLTEDEAKCIVKIYSKKYFVRGPLDDKEHRGKYVLAFMVNYRSKKNA